MKIIRTVNGDIAPGDLGITQPHEHLTCDTTLGKGENSFPVLASPMVLKDTDLLTRELQDFYAAGGRGMVEATLPGWGRDARALQEMSTRSGVHIIACTGFYTQDYIPDFARYGNPQALVNFLLRELREGMDDTDIKAGLLKTACAYPVIEGLEKKCVTAVARAARASGAAITTHSPAAGRFDAPGGNLGYQYLEIFEAEGVDPARVIIGHADQNADIRQLLELAHRGAMIEFDVIGKNFRLLDETRIDLLRRLADAGYEEHLLLSTDRCRISECKAFGGPGYDALLRSFVPRLSKNGFSNAIIHKMLVDNPARILSLPI